MYLADVLATTWRLRPLDGKVLKQDSGPFYPVIQRELDRLVALGMVRISDPGYVEVGEGRYRLRGLYRLDLEVADEFLRELMAWNEGNRIARYLRELTFALSALEYEDIDRAVDQDAMYGDPAVRDGNIVDFDEWSHRNFAADSAMTLASLLPDSGVGAEAERVHLYVDHIARRLHAG